MGNINEAYRYSTGAGKILVLDGSDANNNEYSRHIHGDAYMIQCISPVSISEYAKEPETFGAELIPDPTFHSSSGWTLGTDTIENGIYTRNSGGVKSISSTMVANTTYKIIVDVHTAATDWKLYGNGGDISRTVLASEGTGRFIFYSEYAGGSNSLLGFNNGDGNKYSYLSVRPITNSSGVSLENAAISFPAGSSIPNSISNFQISSGQCIVHLSSKLNLGITTLPTGIKSE